MLQEHGGDGDRYCGDGVKYCRDGWGCGQFTVPMQLSITHRMCMTVNFVNRLYIHENICIRL